MTTTTHKPILTPEHIGVLLAASNLGQASCHPQDLLGFARLLEGEILAVLGATPPPQTSNGRDVHAICVALSDRIKAIAAKPCVGPEDLQRLADIALGVRLAADPRLVDAGEQAAAAFDTVGAGLPSCAPAGVALPAAGSTAMPPEPAAAPGLAWDGERPAAALDPAGAGQQRDNFGKASQGLCIVSEAGTGLSLIDCIARFRAHAQSHPSRDVALGLTFCADFLRDYGPADAAAGAPAPGAAPARARSSLGARVAAARATVAGWPQGMRDSVRLEGGGDRPAVSAGWCTTLEHAGKDLTTPAAGADGALAMAAPMHKPLRAGVVACALPSIDTHAFRALVEQVGYHNLQHVSYSELVTYVNDHVRRVFLAARPSDDALWDQTMGERDTYHDWADKLAAAIAICFGADIGEHSNQNCPWHEALVAIETATEARRLAALMPAVAGAVRALPITLGQAEKLVAFFGGHDAEVTVSERPHDWAGPDGLYAWCSEYPAEGTVFLGATEVDDERARLGSRGAGAAGSAAVAAAEPAPAGAVEPGGASPGANAS